ncbi:MAG: hypothetical protein GXY83_25100 [Rhodopirellula sp.]|nr:hypothetical protein [Rhodopirellula sp.]
MADVSIDIERVVREVLAELGLAPQSPRADRTKAMPRSEAASNTSDGLAAAVKPAPKPSRGELAISSRLVTLAELDGKLGNGIRRLLVPPRAIVTPAVRDELRGKNVELVFGQTENKAATAATAAALLVITHGKPAHAEGLLKSLASDGIPLQPEHSACIMAATDRLAEQLNVGPALGLLLTKHTAAAVCLANRLPGVRAVLGADVATVAVDTAAVGANLLVVDPGRSGLFHSRQIIGQFYRQGPRECPDVFKQRLL